MAGTPVSESEPQENQAAEPPQPEDDRADTLSTGNGPQPRETSASGEDDYARLAALIVRSPIPAGGANENHPAAAELSLGGAGRGAFDAGAEGVHLGRQAGRWRIANGRQP